MVLGSPEAIDEFLKFYLKLPKLCQTLGGTHPETLMRKSLKFGKVTVGRFKHNYRLDNSEHISSLPLTIF